MHQLGSLPSSATDVTSPSLGLPIWKPGEPSTYTVTVKSTANAHTVPAGAVLVVAPRFPCARCHETLWVQEIVRYRLRLESGHESWDLGPGGPTYQRNGIDRQSEEGVVTEPHQAFRGPPPGFLLRDASELSRRAFSIPWGLQPPQI